MCFIISKNYPNELTAEKDIVCWKLLLKKKINGKIRYFAPIMDYYEYIPYKLQKELKLVDDKYGNIYVGYHSFISRDIALLMTWHGGLVAHRFIIPQGARYYMNNKVYISSNIIFSPPKKKGHV